MATIVLAGWREGLQKVALANLQRKLLHLSLKEAKQNVDRLLEADEGILPANPVVLQLPDEIAAAFTNQADKLGALVGFVSFSSAKEPVSRPPKPTIVSPQQAA